MDLFLTCVECHLWVTQGFQVIGTAMQDLKLKLQVPWVVRRAELSSETDNGNRDRQIKDEIFK